MNMNDFQKKELKLDGIGQKMSIGDNKLNAASNVSSMWFPMMIMMFCIVGLFTIILFVNTAINGTLDSSLLMGYMMTVGFTAVVFILVLVSGFAAFRDFTNLSKFCTANNFKLIREVKNPKRHGVVFGIGKNQTINNMIQGSWAGRSFELFNHTYVTGAGRNNQVVYMGVLIVKLSKNLPHVLFDSKNNNELGISSLDGAIPKASQKITLEGDFNKYYDVYVPKEYARDVLYFLTPELMALLIQEASSLDIEVVDDELYVYKSPNYFINDRQEMEKIFNLIETIGGEFSENTRNYSDERVGDRESNLVAEQGRRLNKTIDLSYVITFIIIIVSFSAIGALLYLAYLGSTY